MKKFKMLAIILCLAVLTIQFQGCFLMWGWVYDDDDKDPIFKVPVVDFGDDDDDYGGTRIPLKVLLPNTGMADSALNSVFSVEHLRDITNYDVNYGQVTAGAVEQDIDMKIMSRANYNLMKIDVGAYENLIKKDAFLNLTGLLETYGKNILDAIPKEHWDTVTVNGKIMGIPETAFAGMQDNALIFNRAHLAEIGVTTLPETIQDLTTVLNKLQARFGTNSNYNALAMPGSLPVINPIAYAFDVPDEFYETADGKVESMIYHPKFEDYVRYMNGFVRSKVLSEAWSVDQGTNVMDYFIKGDASVAVVPYWHVKSIVNIMSRQGGISEQASKDNIGWVLRVRGDGTNGTNNQAAAKARGDIGNAYVIVIPFYMWETAQHAINWINIKIREENAIKFLTGKEGEHFNLVSVDTQGAIPITYNNETNYYKLTAKYDDDIKDNSMFMTGNSGAVGKAFWPLREASFDAWPVLVDLDETAIGNVMNLRPTFDVWSSRYITSKSLIYTYTQNAITTTRDSGRNSLESILEALRTMYTADYWDSAVEQEVASWWDNGGRDAYYTRFGN